jgi:hypothetical protein
LIIIPYAYFIYTFTGEGETGNILLWKVLRDLVNNLGWEIENQENHNEDGKEAYRNTHLLYGSRMATVDKAGAQLS